MKIVITVDKFGSAIDKLAQMIKRYNKHLDIVILAVHPKRYTQKDLDLFEKEMKDADLWDAEYWKTAAVLLEKFPWLKDKCKILTHHNPYDLHQRDWKEFSKVVVKNMTQKEELPNSVYIPHGVDLNLHEYTEGYNVDGNVIGMVTSRISSQKGVKEVAQACKELGYKFLLVGRIARPEYFKEVLVTNPDVDFRFDVSEEDLRDIYKEMTILVCNSIDNFESGTMPILEAMASGIPVLTRNVGLVPDIKRRNVVEIMERKSNDIDSLKVELKNLIKDKERRLKMKVEAWRVVMNYSAYRMAKKYANLYNKILFPEHPLASVVVATYNRKEQIVQIIEGLSNQTYPNIELIIADDGSTDGTEKIVKEMRSKVDYPVRYVSTNRTEGYNLAMAWNIGVIEADGHFLIFNGSRHLPAPDAIESFIGILVTEGDKSWVCGERGSLQPHFVEGFSAVRRNDFIRAGMFNERIDKYGGTSQEIRERFMCQGFKLMYSLAPVAECIKSARKNPQKRKDIIEMKDRLWKMGLEHLGLVKK